jgi:signal transduction histidine kinase/HAMP domain-containing protein
MKHFSAFKKFRIKNLITFAFIITALAVFCLNFLVVKIYLYDAMANFAISQEAISDEIYKKQINLIINKTLFALPLSILFPLSLFTLFIISCAQLILRPLKIFKKAADNIAAGIYDDIAGIDSRDEIGELSGAFNRMTASLRDTRARTENDIQMYEKKIQDSAGEMEKIRKYAYRSNKDMENQRMAILNILEDVQASEQELKKTNIALDRGRTELEALKSLSDELLGAVNVPEAMDIAVKYTEYGVDFLAITVLIFDPLDEEDIIFRSYLRKVINETRLIKAREDLLDYLKNNASEKIKATLKVVSNLKPSTIGFRPDNRVKADDYEEQIIPVIIGDQLSGAIHFISLKTEEKREFSNDFIKTIIATFAATVARLQIMNQAQHSKTQTLITSLSDGIIMFSPNQKIILTNPAASQIFKGRKPLGSISELGEDLAGLDPDRNISEVLISKIPRRLGEKQIGNFYFEIIISPVKDAKEKVTGGILIFHDITHLKEIDRMKTEFVSVASHQLRTPLTAIKLFTEMMVRGDVGELSPDQKDYLMNIYESTERMVRLVNDLLSLSRLESGRLKVEPKPTSLIAMVESVISEVKPLADSKKCEIVFNKGDENLPDIPMDPNLVRQVAHNLITNSVRYSKEGAGHVEASIRKKDDFYELKVSDNGIGIAAADQARMFQKFFRADNAVKKETEGSGLGLYVCRMIAEVSGGKIWFESKVDVGTTFYLSLPIKGVAPQAGEKTLPTDKNTMNFS